MNQVILIGRLVRNSELRFTQSGIACCSFTLAVDRPYKDAEGNKQADFIDITTWRKLAEHCNNYLYKGSLVAVSGRLQIDSYDKDGEKRKSARVVAEQVVFLTPKSRDGEVSDDNLPDWGQN